MSPLTASEPITAASLTTQELYRELLVRIGEDPTRDGLVDTPERMEKSMAFLTRGYTRTSTPSSTTRCSTWTTTRWSSSRTSNSFPCASTTCCPSSARPTSPTCPTGKVIGLSKIPRVVDVFARRLQVQERLTTEIADAIADAIDPQGVAVILEAQHLCMMMRGVEKQHSATVTSAMRGVFKTQAPDPQ